MALHERVPGVPGGTNEARYMVKHVDIFEPNITKGATRTWLDGWKERLLS